MNPILDKDDEPGIKARVQNAKDNCDRATKVDDESNGSCEAPPSIETIEADHTKAQLQASGIQVDEPLCAAKPCSRSTHSRTLLYPKTKVSSLKQLRGASWSGAKSLATYSRS